MAVLVILMNSNRGSQLTVYDLPSASRRDCGRPWLCAGMGKAPAWLLFASWPSYKACVVVVLRFPFSYVFSRRHRRCSVELSPSIQRRCHSGKACPSFACSLRTQLASSGHLISPGTSVRCSSSSRPVVLPSRARRRGQSSPSPEHHHRRHFTPPWLLGSSTCFTVASPASFFAPSSSG